MKRIELPCYGIILNLDGNGGGNITSDLHESYPELTEEMQDANTQEEEWEDECKQIDDYNGAINGVESLILALACTGQYDLQSPAFLEAIETAVQACSNNA